MSEGSRRTVQPSLNRLSPALRYVAGTVASLNDPDGDTNPISSRSNTPCCNGCFCQDGDNFDFLSEDFPLDSVRCTTPRPPATYWRAHPAVCAAGMLIGRSNPML